MAISLSIQNAQKLAEGVWSANLSPSELQLFGGAKDSVGPTSIILLSAPPTFDTLKSNLNISPGSVKVLNAGNTQTTIFVQSTTEICAPSNRRIVPSVQQTKSAGDAKFLNDLPSGLSKLGIFLLGEVRKYFPGELKFFPTSSKYVEAPDNFWTIRIQPRDQSFRITVRGTPDLFLPQKSLDIKPDMTGYSCFKIFRENQVVDFIEILRQVRRK